MAYIGRQTTQGGFIKLDDIQSQFNGVTKTFNLTSGGQAFSPGSANSLLVSIAGIIQESGSSYTIDNSTITFATAPTSDAEVFMHAMGSRVNVGSPSAGTVDASTFKSNFGTYQGTISATSFTGDGSQLTLNAVPTITVTGDSTFNGNVSIGGTLSYEDVTNVDAVGLITARSGIEVGSGITFSPDGNAFHTGIVTATSVTTSQGVDLTGLLRENVNIVTGKLSDNQNIDLASGMIHYFTTQETTTSTPNLRFDSSTTLDSKMSIGETIAVTIITTAAAAAYSDQLTIDGTSITENWIAGEVPTSGGNSGVDIYSYTIVKVGNASFLVIANVTKTS